MSRALLLFPVLLAACPSPGDPALPVEGGGEGPERVLDGDATSARIDFSVELDEEVMSIREARREGSLLTVQLDVASFLGACEGDACDPIVTATLAEVGGDVLDEVELSLDEGGSAFVELQFDDLLGGCEEDAFCAHDYTVEVSTGTDGYVTVRSATFATVWIDGDWEDPIFQAEEPIRVLWND